jgi:hypothetical protein
MQKFDTIKLRMNSRWIAYEYVYRYLRVIIVLMNAQNTFLKINYAYTKRNIAYPMNKYLAIIITKYLLVSHYLQ